MISRRFPSTLALLLIVPHCLAQSPLPTNPATGPSVTSEQTVTFVNGPWRFHLGDDASWANSEFDDATWEPYTIDATHASLTLSKTVESTRLGGWQAHGHPGYVGYAWYRISVNPGSERKALAILMPRFVDDAYQLYVNGKLMGELGQFQGHHFVYSTRPMLFPIAAEFIPATGPFT